MKNMHISIVGIVYLFMLFIPNMIWAKDVYKRQGCKQCEKICPQHLTVTKYLKEISKIFDK